MFIVYKCTHSHTHTPTFIRLRNEPFIVNSSSTFAHQALLSTMATRSGEILRHSSKAGIQWMPNVPVAARDPFHYRFFRRSLNSMAISFYSHFNFKTRHSLQNFVHDTTAVLSWHVQKLVAIWWQTMEIQQGKIPIEFELRAYNL